MSTAITDLQDRIAATESELERTKKELMESINSKVVERLKDKNTIKGSVDSIVSQIHDAISVEYNPKFLKIENSLKILRNQIENLEERIGKPEVKLDNFVQNSLLDSLVFYTKIA